MRAPTPRFSFRARLIFPIILAVVPLAVIVVQIASAWRAHELADAETAALQFSRHLAAVHDASVLQARVALDSVAAALGVTAPSGSLTTVLQSAVEHGMPYSNVGVATADGQIAASHAPLPADLVATIHRLVANAEHNFAASGFMADDAGHIGSVFAEPVVGVYAGNRIVFGVVDAGWLRSTMAGATLPPGTVISLFDRSGRLIVRHPRLPDSRERSSGEDPFVRSVVAADHEGVTSGVSTNFDAVPRVFAYVPVTSPRPAENLYVAAGIPITAATAEADRAIRNTGVALILACVFAATVAWFSSGHFTRQVDALHDTTRRLTNGDLEARTRMGDGMPELVQLARSIDAMAEAVSSREREIVGRHNDLMARERSFRAVIEHSADRVILFDRNGTVLYASPTGHATGYRVDELIGQSSLEFVCEDDREKARAILADVSRTPGHTAEATFRVLAKSGEWRWVRAQLSNMLDDPVVAAIVGKYRDVTEARLQRRRASDRLQERVEEGTAALSAANETLTRLSRAIEQTADSVFVTNRYGVIEYVNPAFEEMTGYTSREAVGSTPRIVASGRHDHKFYANLWDTILAGKVFRGVLTNKRKDGRLFNEDQSITPIRDADGAITHFVSTGRDITERKRTEAALRRLNAALEDEAARIASVLHDEAGQFLSSAHITLADVARDLASEQQARIQQVRHHLDLAEQQLRRVSHELHPRMLEDLGLVEAVRFLCTTFSRRSGISVDVNVLLASSCSRAVETVFYRLVQEGLANIAKHSRATQASVTLVNDEARILCSISDNGVGFDVEADDGDIGNFSLGLALMRDRVEAVGGTLAILSGPKRGTQLRASVPVEV